MGIRTLINSNELSLSRCLFRQKGVVLVQRLFSVDLAEEASICTFLIGKLNWKWILRLTSLSLHEPLRSLNTGAKFLIGFKKLLVHSGSGAAAQSFYGCLLRVKKN